MKEIFINKREKEKDLYRTLQDVSLEKLQQLSGNIWTDYNAHDPGVTICDAVNYSLTEYDYRLHFSFQTYLTDKNGTFSPGKCGLYLPETVFPISPVTMADYRKLITESLNEVENVWMYPAEGAQGWYHMLVELSPLSEMASCYKTEKEIRSLYNRNRNLGEGLKEIKFIERYPLVMVAEIETEKGADATALLAEVYWETQQFFVQGMRYYQVEEMLAEGKTADQVLEGPLSNKRLICTGGTEPLVSYYSIPLLYKRLNEIAGIKAVRSLYFTDGKRNFSDRIEVESPEKSYTVSIPVSAASVKVKIRAGKALLTADVQKVAALIFARYIRMYSGNDADRDASPLLPYPSGSYKPLYTHFPVCEDLPKCYGVGSEGLASDETERRKIQAAQLKAYLGLFDGLIRKGLGDLEQIPELLDINGRVPQTEREQKRLEWLEDFRDRIYGEDSDPSVFREYNFYEESRMERLERRRNFQRQIPRWGLDRFKGLDLSDLSPGNMPGIKAYVTALLGLANKDERPIVNVFPLYNLKMLSNRKFYGEYCGNFSHNFILDAPLSEEKTERIEVKERIYTDADYHVLKQKISLLRCNLIFEGLFRCGVRMENFRIVDLWGESDRLLVFHHCEGEWNEWINLGRFGPSVDIADIANCFRHFLVMLNRRCETLYVVEHHLLDPEAALKVTVVFPGWSVRMADSRFRVACEELVSARMPAHLEVDFCWLNTFRMWKFEKAYYAWRKECANGELQPVTVERLKEALEE